MKLAELKGWLNTAILISAQSTRRENIFYAFITEGHSIGDLGTKSRATWVGTQQSDNEKQNHPHTVKVLRGEGGTMILLL